MAMSSKAREVKSSSDSRGARLVREAGVGVLGSEEGEEGDVGRRKEVLEEVEAAEEARLKDGNGGGEGRGCASTSAEDMRRKRGEGRSRRWSLRLSRLSRAASFPLLRLFTGSSKKYLSFGRT